ncbi:MAG: DUF4445 domain-containing protein [Eggerthellaceae bacterium]|nr:DUF4445 domain-containing protein [Eggerthellaceae bacterium]
MNNEPFEMEDSFSSVLDALKAKNVGFFAPCSGKGFCKACEVWITTHDNPTPHPALACQTKPTPDMTIYLIKPASIDAQTSGIACPYLPDKENKEGYGSIFDIGTTTLVCKIFDMRTGQCKGIASCNNPQTVYGFDVITRIEAYKSGYKNELIDSLRLALAQLSKDAKKDAGLDANQAIRSTVLVGNTVMMHFVAGIDPTSIAEAPYKPLSNFGYELDGLNALLQTEHVYAPICVSGYVGADIIADMVAVKLNERTKPILLLDLGTNGEMVLGDKNGIYTCASAAGPVFEAANIACGMPAVPGAISHMRLDKQNKLSFDVIGKTEATGICGSGLIDAIALCLQTGIIDKRGRIGKPDNTAFGIKIEEENGMRLIRFSKNVYLTQEDIRQTQLGKGAIAAGITRLLQTSSIDINDIECVLLAGGFGQSIEPASAQSLGLIPSKLNGKCFAIGNAALSGAQALLLNNEARKQERAIAALCNYLELSSDEGFADAYLGNLNF